MASFDGKFESVKQDWTTPQDLFERLNTEFRFTLDVAASEHNSKCEWYICEEEDALTEDWEGVCWLNPPYGEGKNRLERWVEKAYLEANRGRAVVVMLIPARTNTNWWHKYCMNAAEVRFICGRPKFGGADHDLPQPLALVVFRQTNEPTQFSSFYLKSK